MESEEYEQIPWSNLVTETQPPIDRRLYVAAGVIGALIVLILGVRLFASPAAAPSDMSMNTMPPTVEGTVASPEQSPTQTPPVSVVGAITEADLMAAHPEISEHPFVAGFIAEWFVTDFFTRDGSEETVRDLETRLIGGLVADLPHGDPERRDTFVEWARAFTVDDRGSIAEVEVAYRTVHAVDAGFVRDPVRAVSVSLERVEGEWFVTGLPVATDLP